MAVFGASVPSRTPEEIFHDFTNGTLAIIDVREPREIQAAKIDGSIYIRMNEIPHNLEKIPRDTDVGILCRSGNRSAAVTRFLRENGFSNVFNIAGGINRWSVTLDNSLKPI